VPKEGSTFTFTFELEEYAPEKEQVFDGFKLDSYELEFCWKPTDDNETSVKYVSNMAIRQICDQDNVSEIELETGINQKVRQFK
jgi:hypothetical protein